MSTNSFTNLMQQYGDEAEVIKAQEAREIARRRRKAKVMKGILVLLLAGVAFAGWQHRTLIVETSTTQWKKLTGDVSKSGGVIGNGEKTKNKAKEIQDLAKQRNAIIDGTF